MPDSRKIDSEQPKDGEHIALDVDNEFRNSRLSLSKEKASPDGAHEKLLHKEDEAKIVRDMRVDMVDAKFVSGDHRNGDPKIELDANKKPQFSGLTKEELMKYADDPFWVRLRWFMFLLFWALWVAMLAAAIFIIVKAPACPARTWFEKGPLVEMESDIYSDVEKHLPLLQTSKVEGIFLTVPTYDVLDNDDVLDKFKEFVLKAKAYSIKVIVDLTPNYVSKDHRWFLQSVNNTVPYKDYFKWVDAEYDASGKPVEPNTWVSVYNASAWSYIADRKAFYLHQYKESQPDLDFNNQAVVALLTDAIAKWMGAGAGGVRLNKARQMLVNPSIPAEPVAKGQGLNHGAGHTEYDFYWHTETSDQLALVDLFTKFKEATVAASTLSREQPVFTLKEDKVPELYQLKEQLTLQPNSSAPLSVLDATAAAGYINSRLSATKPQGYWPILQLKADDVDAARELALFSVLLPATPIFNLNQLVNDSSSHSLSHLISLRSDECIQHGAHEVMNVPGRLDVAGEATGEATSEASGGATSGASNGTLLACARYKAGHTGYIAVFNPSEVSLRANLTSVQSVPSSVAIHHVSAALVANNYTTNTQTDSDNVLVPSKSTVVFSYVPPTTVAN